MAESGTSLASPALEIADNDCHSARTVAEELLRYCRESDWAGYDPYDALNSQILQRLPLAGSKLLRLALVQGLKRSPINLRPILRVPKVHNPKGIALFLSALVILLRARITRGENELNRVTELLIELRTKGAPYWSWGYSFDWQTRTKLIERSSPNIICTTFAGNALLDIYGKCADHSYRHGALESARFILEQLYSCDGEALAWFNYTPLELSQVHNANLLGAAFLCRVSDITGGQQFLIPALKAARFSTNRQNKDGSWYYGERESPSQRWIDNFHTGFNLCALRRIGQFGHTDEFEQNVIRGFDYYRTNFFEPDGAPKYFNDRKYPVDIHSAAQSIITLVTLRYLDQDNMNLASKVLSWTIANMWDERGYFHYQRHRFWKNRVPYIRWSQAWMLLALATFLEAKLTDFHSSVTTSELHK